MWRLKFANGDVTILPILEDFEIFKKTIESRWEEVQKRYQTQPMSPDEANVLPPQEEAALIQFDKPVENPKPNHPELTPRGS